jgi:cytoskeletal protein RodZ
MTCFGFGGKLTREVSGNEGQRRLEKRLGHLHTYTHRAFDFVTARFEIPFRVSQKEKESSGAASSRSRGSTSSQGTKSRADARWFSKGFGVPNSTRDVRMRAAKAVEKSSDGFRGTE